MNIVKFVNFLVNESSEVGIILYRLTSNSIVDLNKPGEFYVKYKKDVCPKMLEKSADKLYLITVSILESNIDIDESEKESALHNKSVVVVKDSRKCKVLEVVPFKQ